MKIFGIQKLTLLDYPGKTAATLFFGGCDFRCPFCHNASLVFAGSDINSVLGSGADSALGSAGSAFGGAGSAFGGGSSNFGNNGGSARSNAIETEEVLQFLQKRIGLLDGVCLSGGEPLLQKGLENFISEIKDLGYLVKLDTNGNSFEKLKSLIESDLLDYVAMDIKNSLESYGKTVGIRGFDTTGVEKSADFLLAGSTPYEFRTTVVRELHGPADFHSLGKRFKGADNYFLQRFEASDNTLTQGLSACTSEEMNSYRAILAKYIPSVTIRGM